VRSFLCESYLVRLRDETADAAGGRELFAHLWAVGLLDARLDTLLLPVLLRPATDPEDHLASRGLPRDFVRERLACGACLILLETADLALEHRYPKCIFVTDADGLLQCR